MSSKICQGITQTGDWCKNLTVKGSRYCHLHQTEEDVLRAELEEATKWNHAVAVCQDHVHDIVNHDGCVICRIEELKKEVEYLKKEVEYYESLVMEGR